MEMRLGTNICYFSNYTENTFDLTILRNCTKFESYKGMKIKKKIASRAMGTIDGGLERLEQVNGRIDDLSDVIGILGRESLSDGIGNARIDRLIGVVGHPMTDALVESVGLIGQISEETVREYNRGLYNYFIGNTRVH